MVLSALLLVTLAIAVCAIGIRIALGVLGICGVQTLLWLGLVEARSASNTQPRRRRGPSPDRVRPRP